MKERPITFNAPMVRALLDGRKTQTRRIMKNQPCGEKIGRVDIRCANGGFQWHGVAGESSVFSCPYGRVGDRLWVRESWAFHKMAIGSVQDEDGPFVYASDEFANQYRITDKWTPSIHMPRFASRITMEITGVRVEKLQDISEADAQSEGVWQCPHGKAWYASEESNVACAFAIGAYKELWESISGAGSWDANPWAWVIEFKQVMN